MADMMKKVPVREQDAKERACNFEEVCLGYNADEAETVLLVTHDPTELDALGVTELLTGLE